MTKLERWLAHALVGFLDNINYVQRNRDTINEYWECPYCYRQAGAPVEIDHKQDCLVTIGRNAHDEYCHKYAPVQEAE